MSKTTTTFAALLALAACRDHVPGGVQAQPSSATPPAAATPPNATPLAADPAPAYDPKTVATLFVTALVNGQFDDAVALLPKSAGMPAAELAKQWKDRQGDSGAVTGVVVRPFPEDQNTFSVRATFANGMIDSMATVAGAKVISFHGGFLYTPPAYVDQKAFTDTPLTVGTGKLALPGVLSMPNGAGRYPVVVLEQGSGPSDLDEFDGGDRYLLFRDLAWGLASHGIAVLRYDKRALPIHAFELGIPLAQFTVKQEYFDDLAQALTAVAADPKVDPKRIYLLGHSEAGWLLPWMLRDHPEVRGGIIASGNARPLADILPDQYRYLYGLTPGVTKAQIDAAVAQGEQQAKLSHDPNLSDSTPPEQLPLGVSPAYWKFLQPYDAPAVIATLPQPFLLLQGGRDYNVTTVDHELWKKALAGKDVTAHVYPKADHHYVDSDAPSLPTDGALGGHADPAVIDDIAAWVKAH